MSKDLFSARCVSRGGVKKKMKKRVLAKVLRGIRCKDKFREFKKVKGKKLIVSFLFISVKIYLHLHCFSFVSILV